MRRLCLISVVVFSALLFALQETRAATPLLTEGFDDITTLAGAGWVMSNQSSPLGSTNWFQGNASVFLAQTGAGTSYIAANYNNTSGTGTISNWLITPELDLRHVGKVGFWTRIPAGSTWPDRLEVRLSTNGASTNTGTLATDVGDFTTVLLEINPALATGVYPEAWALYEINTINASGTGRIAFRYFVTDGGPTGVNSNFIGIDTLEVAYKFPWNLFLPAIVAGGPQP